MGIVRDITGQRFGRLTVLEQVGRNKHGRVLWKCKCDCGNEVVVPSGALLRTDGKETRSCGCYAHDQIVKFNKATKKTHGLYGTRIHTVWKDMLYRCEKPSTDGYKDYGGRGISVCEEWHDLIKFADWAYANGYDDTAAKGDCTIERIDVNGNYEPSNCTFVNMFEQNANRRITFHVNIDGESVPLMKAARIYGADYKKLYVRISRYGDSFEEAMRRVCPESCRYIQGEC